MKNKKIIWYGGYIAAALVILIIVVTDLPEVADAGLAILFAVLFSASHVSLWHDKMMEKDKDYRIEVMDERNIAIKEKAGNITDLYTGRDIIRSTTGELKNGAYFVK